MPSRNKSKVSRTGVKLSRAGVVLIGLGVVLAIACVLRLVVGESIGVPGETVFRWRLERLLIGVSVGAALAVGGVLLQALLRNALASPYILGISSGAAVGVMGTTYLAEIGLLGASSAIALGANHAGAVLGAIATLAVVYMLSQKGGFVDPLGLLLVGVVVNAINGAAIMFINYMVPHQLRPNLAVWMMGYFNEHATLPSMWPWRAAFWGSPIIIVLIVTAAGIAVAVKLSRSMDVATLGDDEAESVGLNLPRLRLALFTLAGVLTAGTVVLAGPIGFVGLICPHLVRVMVGPGHRVLVIGSALAGAALLVGADVLIRLADVGQGLMPIGVLTALIGGPVFLWMLRPKLGRGVDV